MNFNSKASPMGRLHLSKILLAMKLTAFIILVTLSTVSAKSYSQMVTLHEKNISVGEVLRSIEKQTNYHFLYDKRDVAKVRSISVDVGNVSVEVALDKCFQGQPLTYKIFNNTIVIKSKEDVITESFIREVIIRGTVTDSKGITLPGVSVKLKGTATGFTTDMDGKYTISVPEANSILVFSYIGFTPQEVAIDGRTTVDIRLSEELTAISEVVVTALGIRREKKALTYAVTEVGGENLTKAQEINLGNALTGRVAGVNATGTATGPGGSSRIVIRGNGSLNGDNQPLMVVNGIPINNSNQGSAGTFGGIDRGDGLTSINPDDIETITVLKGGTAAALYGSRAANGVILITTKSGLAQKGLGVDYNTTYTMETPRNLLDWQYEYGAGSRGAKPTSASEAVANGRMSWGAKLDGSSVIQPDGQSRQYNAQKDNIKNFYDNGSTFTNTLALTGGAESLNFRFSASNLDNSGIVPNNSLNRKTFNLSANATLAKKLSFEGRVQYSIEDNKNRPFTADFQKNPNAGTQIIASSIDVRTLAPGYDAKGNEFLWNDYIFATNPYFAINKMQNGDTRKRFIGSLTSRYSITEDLYARVRVGIDQFNFDAFDLSEPSGTAFNNQGRMNTNQNYSSEINGEVIIGYNKAFGNFSVSVLAGGNQMNNLNRNIQLNSGPFNVPFQYFVGNGSAQTFGLNFNERSINSVFGSADIGYRSFLYLTLSARQDWFSTLAKDKNSLLYPSAGLSFVASEVWGSKPSWLDYAKLRASWAQVGGGAPNPYGLDLTYVNQPQTYVNGATLMTINGNTIPNALTPYTSTTTEAGIELRTMGNRLGLDLTVYDRTTTDDIVNASVPFVSGFSSVALNVGEIRNRGVELLLTGVPVKSSGFNWDVAYNMAYNKNTVLKIADGLTRLQLPDATTRTQNGGIYHYEGEPFGMIAGNRVARNASGQIIYNSSSGIPQQGPLEILGPGVPPLTIGLSNNFTFKNFNLGVLLDGKFGAYVYSATNAYGTQFGLEKRTVANGIRETGLPVAGVNQAGAPYTANVSAQTYYSAIWATITEEFVTPADFIKLRSITFGYNLPPALIAKTPFQTANLSFVARNLFLIYNTARNIDPESSYSNGNGQGLENFGLPTVRSFGLNLSVKF